MLTLACSRRSSAPVPDAGGAPEVRATRLGADKLPVDRDTLLDWLRRAEPSDLLFVAAAHQETAAPLQHTMAALLATFHAQGMSAPDDVRLGEYLESALRDRVDASALAALARQRKVTVEPRRTGELTGRMKALLARKTPGHVPADSELRRRAEETLLIAALLDAELAPTDEELQRWVDQNHARLQLAEGARIAEIVLAGGQAGDDAERLRARADALTRELASADEAAFEAAARDRSHDVDNEGLGWLEVGKLPPALAAAIRGTAAGKLVVVDSPRGVHVVRVHEKATGVSLTLTNARPQIVRARRQEHTEAKRDELRRRAFDTIEVLGFVPPFRAPP